VTTTAPSTALDADHAFVLHAELTDAIREEGSLPETEASRLADAVIRRLRCKRAGQTIYIPGTLSTRERHARDNGIRQEFNGRNMRDVCRKYDVSRNTVYRALGRQY